MMTNCWDFNKCNEKVCPARTEKKLNGVHHGINGGRSCWGIAGTRCGGKVQGKYAMKIGNCMNCDFYKLVRQEEGSMLLNGLQIVNIVQN